MNQNKIFARRSVFFIPDILTFLVPFYPQGYIIYFIPDQLRTFFRSSIIFTRSLSIHSYKCATTNQTDDPTLVLHHTYCVSQRANSSIFHLTDISSYSAG